MSMTLLKRNLRATASCRTWLQAAVARRCLSSTSISDQEQVLPIRRPIYVSATKEHVGKTSVSLALLSGLQKRFETVGFMKPVGQKSIDMTHPVTGETIHVEKDAALVASHFGLFHQPHFSIHDTNPVQIPKGYTKDFLDGKHTSEQQEQQVKSAFRRVDASSQVVLCEGTGHCGVGSIVHASNATVASWLQAGMVLVANGGLGRCVDELDLNRIYCEAAGVHIAGVIVNKVHPEKYEQTKHYLTKALEEQRGIPLLGCIPDRPFLGCPALADLERLLNGSLVSGQAHRLRHYRNSDVNLVATSLTVFLKTLRQAQYSAGQRTLYICHASRNDILLGFLMESFRSKHIVSEVDDAMTAPPPPSEWESAMVVTGCEDSPISTQVLEIVTSLPPTAPPVILTSLPTDEVMEAIYKYTPKLNAQDTNRVATTVEHYEPYINFDRLLKRIGVVPVPQHAPQQQEDLSPTSSPPLAASSV